MARINFKPGVRFLLKGEWFVTREVLLDKQVLLESQSFGGRTVMLIDDLVDAFASGELRFEVTGPHVKKELSISIPVDYTIQDFSSLPPKKREEALRRYKIIRPLLDVHPAKRTRQFIEQYVARLQSSKDDEPQKNCDSPGQPPRKGKVLGTANSRASVERWLKVYLESGQDIRSLVCNTGKAGNPGGKRLDTRVDDIIKQVLDECDKNRHFRTAEAIFSMVINKIAIENRTRPSSDKLPFPSKSTIRRRINEFGIQALLHRRRSRVEQQPDEPVREGPRPTRILERIEFDSTWLDLIVVDEKDRLPIGRPSLTFAIDKYSGYPVGFYVGFEPPSYKTTMSCALHAFMPKPDTHGIYDTKHSWRARGLPELAVIDNGKEYVNRHLLEAFGMLGIVVDQCPVRTPWFKGSIERFFRTTNTELVHALPGSTFSNVLERGDYDAAKYACISLSGFIKILHIFLLDVYAQQWNKGVGGIPEKLWLESEAAGFIPSLPSSKDELQVLLFWNDTRPLQRNGIEFENIVYQSDDLIRLRTLLQRENREVMIRVNPDDMSCIYVLDPVTNSEWIRFDANDKLGYTQGLSLWKHRLIRKYVNVQKGQVDIVALAEAKAKIQKIVEEEFLLTKKSKHRIAARRFNSNSKVASKLPKSVRSEGFSLAPEVESSTGDIEDNIPEDTSINDEPSKTPKKRSKKQKSKESNFIQAESQTLLDQSDSDLDPTGWEADFHLPQSKHPRNLPKEFDDGSGN